MTKIIIFKNVSKKYNSAVNDLAVNSLNLEVEQGEFFCLVGPSGCGKSTLLQIIAGLQKPTSGEIIKPDNVSMVFQSGALLPWLTVDENIGFGLKMKALKAAKINQQVNLYSKMVGLTDFGGKYPRELSGGQRQRVGIARALTMEPEVLLLDEPFSALDPLTTDDLHQDLLKIWQDNKLTVVMVSHLLEEAVLLSDQVGVMKNGQIKGIVEVGLSRPRDSESKEFIQILDKVKKILV